MSELLDFMESLKPGFEQLQKVMQELSDSTHQTTEKDKQIETLRRNNKELAKRLAAKVTHIDKIEKVNCDLQNNIARFKEALEAKDNIISKQLQENKALREQIKEVTAERDKWKGYCDQLPKVKVDPTNAVSVTNKIDDITDEVKALQQQVQDIIAKHSEAAEAKDEDGFDSLESIEIFIDDGTNNPINIKAEGKSIDFNALFDELLAKLEVDEKR